MPTQVLAPGTTAASSSDITVTSSATVAMYRPLDDSLLLEDGLGDLLTEGGDVILFETQSGDACPINDYCEIMLKDPVGTYGPTGKFLYSHEPYAVLGPGVWRVDRPAVSIPIGIQQDGAS